MSSTRMDRESEPDQKLPEPARKLPNPVLPIWEVRLYIAVWVLIAGKGIYALFMTSKEYSDQNPTAYELRDGWSFLNRRKDVTDREWQFWRTSMFTELSKWFLGHICIGQIARWTNLFPLRKYLFIAYSFVFFVSLMGFRTWLFLAAEVFVTCSVAWFTASPVLVWIVSIGCLSMFHVTSLHTFVFEMGLLRFERGYVVLQFYILTMSVQRFTSCALCIAEGRRKKAKHGRPNSVIQDDGTSSNSGGTLPRQEDGAAACGVDGSTGNNETKDVTWDWADVVCYVVYLPTAIAGPMMTFDQFLVQFHQPLKPWTVTNFVPILTGITRTLCWALVYEFLLHYLYCWALIHRTDLLESLPLWSIAAVGFMCGQLFMVKYLVIWAQASAMARMDQLVTPGVPSCISHIYLYSEMWKTFDRGLYGFMKQHIYVPLGGSRHGLIRQSFALVACFSFVYLWHGMSAGIFWWTFLNFNALLLEAMAGRFTRLELVERIEARLSPAASRRIRSLFIAPVLLMSTFSTITFLCGASSGFVIFYRICFEGFPVSLLLALVLAYCSTQTGKEVENVKAERTKSKEL